MGITIDDVIATASAALEDWKYYLSCRGISSGPDSSMGNDDVSTALDNLLAALNKHKEANGKS